MDVASGDSSVPDLTISIISADNLALLLPCLRSVFNKNYRIKLEVYVVDNASTDGTAHAVQSEFQQIRVVRNTRRLGFSTNNNKVLALGQGRYLMMLNDDTLILDSALDHLVAFMDLHSEVGAAGSYLMNPDGSSQECFAKFPSPFIEAIWPATSWSRFKIMRNPGPMEVDSVCGAAMLVRRLVVKEVGVLDASFDPIYSEEVDWCYRIKQAGWKIYTVPQSKIIHFGSQTMDRFVEKKYELLLSHKLQFFRKHLGSGAARRYRITLAIATFFKLLWWTCTSAFPKINHSSKEKARIHRHVLRQLPTW